MLAQISRAAHCPTNQAESETALLETENAWAEALQNHDVNGVGCILADTFEGAGTDGKVSNGAEVLAHITHRRPGGNHLSGMTAHLYGERSATGSEYGRGCRRQRTCQGGVHGHLSLSRWTMAGTCRARDPDNCAGEIGRPGQRRWFPPSDSWRVAIATLSVLMFQSHTQLFSRKVLIHPSIAKWHSHAL